MSTTSSWGFDGFTGDRVLVIRASEAFGPSLTPLSPALARGFLRRWLADPIERRKLLDVHGVLTGRADHEPWTHGGTHEPMLEDLARAFERGELLLLAQPDLPTPQLSPRPEDEPPRPQGKNRSWIEIELLDEDGRRVAAELVVTLPDGTKLRPAFSGFLRIDDIDPGTCDIEFPKIDGREWGPTATRR
jgi:hypothetical protein